MNELIQRSGELQLAELLAIAVHDHPSASGDDTIGTKWAGQLVSPLLWLQDHSGISMPEADLVTLEMLLFSPGPSVELLSLMAQFGKRCATNPMGGTMPPEMGRVLYFLAIALADREGHRITSLDPAEVRKGLAWAAQRAWLDDRTHRLIAALLTSES